jgi:hypothetical protein
MAELQPNPSAQAVQQFFKDREVLSAGGHVLITGPEKDTRINGNNNNIIFRISVKPDADKNIKSPNTEFSLWKDGSIETVTKEGGVHDIGNLESLELILNILKEKFKLSQTNT